MAFNWSPDIWWRPLWKVIILKVEWCLHFCSRSYILLSVTTCTWISDQFLFEVSWVIIFVFLCSQIFQLSYLDSIWILTLRLSWHFNLVLPLRHLHNSPCLLLLLYPVLMSYLFNISPTWSQSAGGTGWRDTSHRCVPGSCKSPEANCGRSAASWLYESD